MSEAKLNGGLRVWIPWSLLLGAAAGLIVMYADVKSLKSQMGTKADREVVTTQYESLLRELQAIRLDLQQLRRP